jgi:hypothetical protein
MDLLLTPTFQRSPGTLKGRLRLMLESNSNHDYEVGFAERLSRMNLDFGSPGLAFNQNTVVARLWFHEMVRSALPLTQWWWKSLSPLEDITRHPSRVIHTEGRDQLLNDLRLALTDPTYDALRHSATKNLAWFARVAGTLVLATDLTVDGEVSVEALEARSQDVDALIDALVELIDIGEMPEPADAEIHNINRNREATTAIYRSVPTVKADAAQRLFDVRGRGVTWAILDSGIDATHWAFRERDVNGSPAEEPFTKKTTRRGEIWENHTRIRATYDFTRIRDFLFLLLSRSPYQL